jgi:hypothetical protein
VPADAKSIKSAYPDDPGPTGGAAPAPKPGAAPADAPAPAKPAADAAAPSDAKSIRAAYSDDPGPTPETPAPAVSSKKPTK